MNFKGVLFAIIIAALATGCEDSPYAGRLNSERPELHDVAGLYKFEQQSLIESTTLGKCAKTATIMLNMDGTFKVSNVPCWGGGMDSDTAAIYATGKWSIDTVGTVTNSWGREKKYWGLVLKPSPRSFPSDIGFMDDAPLYKLLINYNDHDLDEVMIFGKN